jgi:hypothetical protein
MTEQTDFADVVIGLIPPSPEPGSIGSAVERLMQSGVRGRIVVVHPPCPAPGCKPSAEDARWSFIEDAALVQDRSTLAESFGRSFRTVFELAGKLNARACAVITSDLSTVTPAWADLLVNPVIDDGFDLVAPCYAPYPFDGVINRAIVYPIVRALYGRRIRNPIGPDFGLSGKMVARMAAGQRPRLHPLVSLVPEAIASEMKICQSYLGARVYPSLDWGNLSPFLSQVLAVLFLDVERFAPWWQRARGSQPVPEFGTARAEDTSTATVDPVALIQGFQAGARSLIETWGTVLPPSTLVELRKLAKQSAERFRMEDTTWARIVYDFALAYRLRANSRTVNSEQLLRAFTPLYMGWVASYALEIAGASGVAVEQRIEDLCTAFEGTKPYFVARWRWPDRFTP